MNVLVDLSIDPLSYNLNIWVQKKLSRLSLYDTHVIMTLVEHSHGDDKSTLTLYHMRKLRHDRKRTLTGFEEISFFHLPRDPEDFFRTLPIEHLTVDELALLKALQSYLENRSEPVQITEACKELEIQQCQWALLPPEVPIEIWIARRIGGEVDSYLDDSGCYSIKLMETPRRVRKY